MLWSNIYDIQCKNSKFYDPIKVEFLHNVLKDVCEEQIRAGSHFTPNAPPFDTANTISRVNLMLRKTFIL